MDRTRIADTVLKNIRQIAELEEIDPASSMKDYGISSLDIVEIVSLTMRELKVKVPRSELMKVATIDGLIDLIERNAPATATV